MNSSRDQQHLYERQSAERGDMERHYRWFAPRLRLEETARLVRETRSARVLEVGCGDGVLLEAVTRSPQGAPQCIAGVDLSFSRLERARVRVSGAFACASADALPIRSGSFDRVICAEVLEHLIDPGAALAELARVLAPSGRLLISVPVVGWSRWIEARLMGRVRFLDEEEHLREYAARPLERCDTLDALRGDLERLGLRVLFERGVYGWPHRGERVWHTLFARGPLHGLAVSIDRAFGASGVKRWGRWVLIEAEKSAAGAR
jgi:2-polyprenyl-3-methyl-5-hydroxy-6-metoxy-1,4-benzoquinol methylase